MALGPMSTPRRPWPRSIGTPKMPTGRRSFSGKGDTPGTPRVGRGLEPSLGRQPDGVDAAEVHVRLLEGEHAPEAPYVRDPCPVLVGEQVTLGVEPRREDGVLDGHAEVENVDERLQDGCGYARGAGGAEGDEPALRGGDDGRAHARDEPLAGVEGVETFRVQLWLAEAVVERYPRAGHHEPRAVPHAGGDRDGEPVGINAREVARLRATEALEDALALRLGVLLAGKAGGNPVVARAVEVGCLPVFEREPHGAGHDGYVLVVRHRREVVGGDDP